MKLWIMRHGEAEALRGDNDSVRGLTPHGHGQVLASARWLKAQGLGSLRIVVSPYRRARQTADIVADIIAAVAVEQEELLTPDGDPRRVCQWLERQADPQLLLVSHMPLVAQLTSWLSDGVLAGSPFGVAQIRTLEMELVGPGQARRLAGFAPD